MPTVFTRGPYRIFFNSNESQEPPHVHVERDSAKAKFLLAPARLAQNSGFRPHEVNKIMRIVLEHEKKLGEAWDEYFRGRIAFSDRNFR